MCSISNSGRWIKPFMIGNLFKLMQVFKTALIILVALWIFVGVMVSDCRAAGNTSVTAELSRAEINAGEMAELQVHVSGADNARVPQEIQVDGLQIRLTGQSTQVQMVNFKVSSSVVYSYIVMPMSTGKFTIPSIPVRTDSGTMQTAPLSFTVLDSSGVAGQTGAGGGAVPVSPQPGMPGFATPRQVPQGNAPPTEGRMAFGEITTAKKKIYAGEMIPVEISYYFDARYPVQILSNPDLASEGLLVERFPDPKQSREDRDGITYNILTFHTLLSAVKPGSIDVPPVKLKTQIQMPGAVPPGFDNPVFQQMLGGQNPFTQTRELMVKTPSLHFDILPLPKEGRPASFAGAVGEFDSDAVVANPKPLPGDPAVLTVKIGGKGNFRAMGPPILTDSDGWRTYPPADKIDSSDALSLEGVKSFDFTLIAQEKKTNSPGSEFSYFDPTTEKYVTLSTKPLPLKASPLSDVVTPTATALSTPVQPSQGVNKSPAVTANSNDGEPLSSFTVRSWKTPVQRAEFLIGSLAMLLAAVSLGGILHFRDLQTRQGSVAEQRRRLTALWASLNSGTLDAASTYDAALEYATLLGVSESDEVILWITARRDVLKYGVGGSVLLGSDERSKLLETLGKISSNKASS